MTSPLWKTDRSLSIDPALLGMWTDGASTVAFSDDSWFFVVGNSLATITPDGQTLNDAGTILSRVLGSGQIIEGVWAGMYLDSGVTWVEDRHYRQDGTYTIQWTADGDFESVLFGSYTYRGGVLAVQERRARVTTGSSGTIAFDVPFGPDSTGTYVLTPQDELLLTVGGITSTYNRL
jgi:hypothetical protein